MKNINIITAFCAILVFKLSAHAISGTIANGGDAVVCYTDSTRQTITSVQMFDYWEQEKVAPYPGGLNMGAESLTVQEKINLLTNRIAKFDPNLADKTKTIALSIANNISNYLVTSYNLPEIDDANPKAVPGGNCFIEQYAVQWNDVSSGIRRFAISDKFYNHVNTSNDVRAGIILHEAIYRQAKLKGSVNSDGIRIFNYLAATSKFDDLNLFQTDIYFNLVSNTNLNIQDCRERDSWISTLIKPFLNLNEKIYVKRLYSPLISNAVSTCFNQEIKIQNDSIYMPAGAIIDPADDGTFYGESQYRITTPKQVYFTFNKKSTGQSIKFKTLTHEFCYKNDFVSNNLCDNSQSAIGLNEVVVDQDNNLFNIAFFNSTPLACAVSKIGSYGKQIERDSVILNKNTGAVIGCDVNIDYTINSQLLKLTRIYAKNSNNLQFVILKGPGQLNVVGSLRNSKISLSSYGTHAYLNSNYEIVRYYPDVVLKNMDGVFYGLDSHFVPAGASVSESCYFSHSDNYCDFQNGVYGKKIDILKVHTNGMDLMATSWKSIKPYCISLGYENGESTETKLVYISNPTSFYNMDTNSVEIKSDEEVNTYSVKCFNSTPTKINL